MSNPNKPKISGGEPINIDVAIVSNLKHIYINVNFIQIYLCESK